MNTGIRISNTTNIPGIYGFLARDDWYTKIILYEENGQIPLGDYVFPRGQYIYHVWTQSVSNPTIIMTQQKSIEYLIVGAGAAGGYSTVSGAVGGGGAGGHVLSGSIDSQIWYSFNVHVGNGGQGTSSNYNGCGNRGDTSYFQTNFNWYSSDQSQGGGSIGSPQDNSQAWLYGAGAGASANSSTTYFGGTGTVYNGGSSTQSVSYRAGGGGAGAGGNGGDWSVFSGPIRKGGQGGTGSDCSDFIGIETINGQQVIFGDPNFPGWFGGGGAGSSTVTLLGNIGGKGGGGSSNTNVPSQRTGKPNTGGGGCGGYSNSTAPYVQGDGGSGLVVLRYLKD